MAQSLGLPIASGELAYIVSHQQQTSMDDRTLDTKVVVGQNEYTKI
jgi:hypothetical protein